MNAFDVVVDSKYDAVNRQLGSSLGARAAQEYLEFNFDGLKARNVVGVSVLWVNLPFTFYLVNQANNTFFIRTPDPLDAGNLAADTITTCVLAPGSYTSTSIGPAIVAAIVAAGAPDAVSYTVEIEETTLKLIVVNSAGPFRITFANRTLSDMLGFIDDNTSLYFSLPGPIPSGGVAERVVSPFVFNLLGNMILTLDLVNFSTGLPISTKTGGEESLIRFPINANFGEVIYFAQEPQMIHVDWTSIPRFGVRLQASDKRPFGYTDFVTGQVVVPSSDTTIPLNGEGFQIGLRFYESIDGAPTMPRSEFKPVRF